MSTTTAGEPAWLAGGRRLARSGSGSGSGNGASVPVCALAKGGAGRVSLCWPGRETQTHGQQRRVPVTHPRTHSTSFVRSSGSIAHTTPCPSFAVAIPEVYNNTNRAE